MKLYCCGITPYSNSHIGHVRVLGTAIFLKIYFERIISNSKIKLMVNWTDIDSKILSLSRDLNPIRLAKVQVTRVRNQLKNYLDWSKIDMEPKVSNHLETMLGDIMSMRDKLVFKNSGIYLGKFHHTLLNKETNGGFALWRRDPIRLLPHLPKGIPGWHLECSTMIAKNFGSCDLHIGGRDLIFPHHVNEDLLHILRGLKTVSKKWYHVGLINISGVKMSKSLGNVILVKNFNPSQLKIYLTSFEANKDINFSWSSYWNILKIFQKLLTKFDIFEEVRISIEDWKLWGKSNFNWRKNILNDSKLIKIMSLSGILPNFPDSVKSNLKVLKVLRDSARLRKLYLLSDKVRILIESYAPVKVLDFKDRSWIHLRL